MSFESLPRELHLLIAKTTQRAMEEEEWFRASPFRPLPEDGSNGVRWTNYGIAQLASVNKTMRLCCSSILFSGLRFLGNQQVKQVFPPGYVRWVILVVLRTIVFFERRPVIASHVKYERCQLYFLKAYSYFDTTLCHRLS